MFQNILKTAILFLISSANAVGDKQSIVGVNMGGYFVLEPWITPSLFYQFLDKGKGEVAFDSYTFCEVLGPETGNKWMKAHWEKFYTEDYIKDLSLKGI
jgi:glucan 1,3-beta-glucosidase